MSGHSKWKTIQHKKGAADAKRGKLFSKFSKELLIAARSGGGDADANSTLRTIVQNARAANMPMDNIERAIKKGTGELEGGQLDEVVYEGYAEAGVGLVIKVLTDNKNRASAEIRHIFTKHGSSFAQQGAVSRAFQRKGKILVDAATVEEDDLMAVVLDAGAEDLQREDEQFEILCDPTQFAPVCQALEQAGIATQNAEVSMISELQVPIADAAVARRVFRFIEALEDNEDVQNVYSNIEVDDAVLAQLEAG
jgi:YebC/PmpR family DNA-binding regulatory protein